MSSVPFTVPRLYGGLAECQGLLRAEGDSLVLEYQVQDRFWGLFRRNVPGCHHTNCCREKQRPSSIDHVLLPKTCTVGFPALHTLNGEL